MSKENKRCPRCRSSNVRAVTYKADYKPRKYEFLGVCMNCGYHGFIPPETWEKWNKRSDENDRHNS